MGRSDELSVGKITYDTQRQMLSVSINGRRNGRAVVISCAFGMPEPGVTDSKVEAALRQAARQMLLDAADAVAPPPLDGQSSADPDLVE